VANLLHYKLGRADWSNRLESHLVSCPPCFRAQTASRRATSAAQALLAEAPSAPPRDLQQAAFMQGLSPAVQQLIAFESAESHLGVDRSGASTQSMLASMHSVGNPAPRAPGQLLAAVGRDVDDHTAGASLPHGSASGEVPVLAELGVLRSDINIDVGRSHLSAEERMRRARLVRALELGQLYPTVPASVIPLLLHDELARADYSTDLPPALSQLPSSTADLPGQPSGEPYALQTWASRT
jgi:hypothetical protein